MGQWDPSCATDPTPCSAKALTQVITTAFDSTVEGANCLPESNACAKEHQNLTIVAKCRTAFHENGGTAAKLQTSAGSKKHWDTSLIAWCTRLNSELGQPTHVLNDHSPNLGETASTWIPLSTDSTRFPCQAANNFRKVVFCRCRRLLERDTTGGEGWLPLVAQPATKLALQSALPEIPHARQTAHGTPWGQAKNETQRHTLSQNGYGLKFGRAGKSGKINRPPSMWTKSWKVYDLGFQGLSGVPLLTTI